MITNGDFSPYVILRYQNILAQKGSRNMRKILSYLMLVMAVMACQSLANAQNLYTVTDLGTLGGSSSFALAINAAGVVTGESDDGVPIGPGYKGDYSRAFIFRKGMPTMQPIGPSPSGIGQAINAGNEIVGGNFVYKNGVTSHPGGSSVSFTGVNNSGEICGTIAVPEAGTLGNTNAMLFRNGVITNLGTLGGPNSLALGLNNKGQIVGYFTLPSDYNNFHAFLWQNGRMFDIGTLGPASDALNYYSQATAINDHGQIVGYSLTTSGLIDAFLWQNGVMRDLGVVPGINDPDRSISASAINNRGEIVGSQNNSSGVQSFIPNVAFLYTGGQMYNLNLLLVPSETNWVIAYANGINDSGQIAATGTRNGLSHALLLNPFDRR